MQTETTLSSAVALSPAEEQPIVIVNPVMHVESKSTGDMPDGVLDGKLGEICQKRMSAYPLAYAWPAILTVAGVKISQTEFDPTKPNQCVQLDENDKPIYIQPGVRANLYTCLVGLAGTGKTSAFDQAIKILGVEEPTLMAMKAGSGEGLVEHLDANGDTRLLYPDEISHLLEKANSDHSVFSFILNSAYYHDADKLATKKSTVKYNARLSLMGGTTPDLFHDSFGFRTAEGLYDRFLFGVAPDGYVMDWQPPDNTAESLTLYPVKIDPSVWEVKTSWIKQGIASRVAEIAIKVAFICACADHRVLEGKDLAPALELAKYEMRVREVLSPSPAERDEAKIQFRIQRYMDTVKDGEWVTRSTLFRKSHADRYGVSAFDKAINGLLKYDLTRAKAKNAEIYRRGK
jgi:hypothetical protein